MKGLWLLGAAVVGGLVLSRRAGGLGNPSPGDPFQGRVRGGPFYFYRDYGAPVVIFKSTEVLENPCRTPWLFSKPEEACRNYLEDQDRAARVRAILGPRMF